MTTVHTLKRDMEEGKGWNMRDVIFGRPFIRISDAPCTSLAVTWLILYANPNRSFHHIRYCSQARTNGMFFLPLLTQISNKVLFINDFLVEQSCVNKLNLQHHFNWNDIGKKSEEIWLYNDEKNVKANVSVFVQAQQCGIIESEFFLHRYLDTF